MNPLLDDCADGRGGDPEVLGESHVAHARTVDRSNLSDLRLREAGHSIRSFHPGSLDLAEHSAELFPFHGREPRPQKCTYGLDFSPIGESIGPKVPPSALSCRTTDRSASHSLTETVEDGPIGLSDG
jgi:hypothetical protein